MQEQKERNMEIWCICILLWRRWISHVNVYCVWVSSPRDRKQSLNHCRHLKTTFTSSIATREGKEGWKDDEGERDVAWMREICSTDPSSHLCQCLPVLTTPIPVPKYRPSTYHHITTITPLFNNSPLYFSVPVPCTFYFERKSRHPIAPLHGYLFKLPAKKYILPHFWLWDWTVLLVVVVLVHFLPP